MLKILIFTIFLTLIDGWFYGRPDPGLMTRGGVWPLPWTVTTYNNFTHNIDPTNFQFVTSLTNCDIIQQALTRYKKWAFPLFKAGSLVNTSLVLTQLNVNVAKGCDSGYPQMGMDESYTLTMDPKSATANLTANEVWGALRGLESFSQLVFKDSNDNWFVMTSSITDYPRFPHRGIMLDSSRHFLSVSIIKRNLDLMAMNKLNVFHWHLTDSESFPYESKVFPNLTKYGAYTPKHIYTQDQIKDIINYARLLGIRVVPEFDTPGHMGAWGPGQPGLLAQPCVDPDTKGTTSMLSNIIDPTKDANLQFIGKFFDEALGLFPDKYMHFGGDETIDYQIGCWLNNTNITQWMKNQNMGTNATLLLNYYFSKSMQNLIKQRRIDLLLINIDASFLVKFVQNSTAKSNASMIFWQEVLDQKVAPNSSIAHVWKGGNYSEMMNEMFTVTKNNHLAIFSSCWYINIIEYGALWGYTNKYYHGVYYECNPTDFNGTDAQKNLVLGGEACLWGEMVDGTNLIARLWPNAAATAERLWSDLNQTRVADIAWPRLHEARCRMMARGYQVQPPNYPDYCPDFWDPVFDNSNTNPTYSTTPTPKGSAQAVFECKKINVLLVILFVLVLWT